MSSKNTLNSHKLKHRPCRLTVGTPNNEAEALLRDVKHAVRALDERSFGTKYGCALCWCCLGVFFLVAVLATTVAAAGAVMVFVTCVALGVLYNYVWQEDTPNLAIDDEGVFHPSDISAGAATAMLDVLARYAEVLRPLRAAAA